MLQTMTVFVVNTLIYACIGMLVGIAITCFQGRDTQLISLLWRSALTGVVIGTITKLSVVFLHRNRNLSLWGLYGLMLVIAGGLTWIVSYSLDFATQLAVLAVVAPLALLTMYLNVRYSHRLNDGLKRKQSSLTQKSVGRMP